jgi:hypothetical protein
MKNIILVLIFTFGFITLKAQLSFEPKEMITVKNKVKTVEKIDGKITINSDTTEIEIKINSISYTEKIGELSLFNDFGEVRVYLYEQEEGYMVVQIYQDKLYSVSFQENKNKLQFK